MADQRSIRADGTCRCGGSGVVFAQLEGLDWSVRVPVSCDCPKARAVWLSSFVPEGAVVGESPTVTVVVGTGHLRPTV